MSENNDNLNTSEGLRKKLIRSHFDGIKFLWQVPVIKHFLNLMILLCISMSAFYLITFALLSIFGDLRILWTIYISGDFFFLGLFLYILSELTHFYMISRKNKLFPEKNKFLTMKSSPEDVKTYKSHRLVYLLIVIIIIAISDLAFRLIILHVIYWMIFTAIVIFILYQLALIMFGILAFISTRDTMKSFELKYSEKYYKHWYWTLILFPIPWLIFIVILYNYQYIQNAPGIDMISFAYIQDIFFMYLIMCIIGIPALFKKGWKVGYTISLTASMFTILIVIVIPFLIGFIIGLGGTILSFIGIFFLFIQGTLDEKGDDVREYYKAWDKKLRNFNITEKDISSLNNEDNFFSTPLDTNVPNAVCNLIIGLWILTYCLYIFIVELGMLREFAIPSLEGEIFLINSAQYFIIDITLIIFTFIIMVRQAKKHSKGKKNVLMKRT